MRRIKLSNLWTVGLVGLIAILARVDGLRGDEGMLPISEIGNFNLAERGIRLTAQDLFAPGSESLVDGIVRVNGCTGSFVSPQGLILTNHHCAYRAIQANSTAARDLLKDGFLAADRAAEIPAVGYTVRITQSYRDVSAEVLSVVRPDMDFTERTQAIERQSKRLEQEAEQAHPGLRAEVAEMFIGETYGLFLYVYLRDVRLVFAPPAAVGNFGGEVDNWEWPRHTGDFAFMRAYTAPDGSAADYSPDNVPFQPRRFLQVRPAGVNEGDAVMLLGYPGRTARHYTASYLQMLRDVTLPATVRSYQWQIGVMEAAGRDDRAVAIKHANRVKSLANVEKRSRGQLQGLQRAGLVEQRLRDEQALATFIAADPERQARYGQLLADIAAVYSEMGVTAERELLERSFVDACRTLYLAYQVYDAAMERQKPDLEREAPYMERNFAQTIQQWRLAQRDLDPATDQVILTGLLEQWIALTADKNEEPQLAADVLGRPVDEWFAASPWAEPDYLEQVLGDSPAALAARPDPALQWVVAHYPRLVEIRQLEKERQGRLNQLYGDLITVKKQFQAKQFIPDANGTLRLTSGRVRGFSPADAVYKAPFTTLRGLIEKTTQVEPFETPAAVLQRIEAQDFGTYAAPGLGQVPVNLLYDTDTTGGNSGSPIMDGGGRLVGVNFDRAFEATINDFAWNADYSRSIGVDIRYVLWITGTVYGGEHLLREMEVGVERRPYWVFLKTGQSAAGRDAQALAEMQAGHLANFRTLHARDRLAAAGPFGDPQRQLRGMVYLQAADAAEVQQSFAADPFVQEQLLRVVARPIADQIGEFRSSYRADAMETWTCVVFRSVPGQAIDGGAARASWEQLREWQAAGNVRLAIRFEPPTDEAADESSELGVVIFRPSDEEQIAQWLQQLPVVQQQQVQTSTLPLYLSAGLLDDHNQP